MSEYRPSPEHTVVVDKLGAEIRVGDTIAYSTTDYLIVGVVEKFVEKHGERMIDYRSRQKAPHTFYKMYLRVHKRPRLTIIDCEHQRFIKTAAQVEPSVEH